MINVVCGIRSTGRICTDIATELEAQGHEVMIAYGRENVPMNYRKYAIRIGTNLDVKIHGLRARLLDGCGSGSKRATKEFIKWAKKYDPDVIHLHNIHGYYINIEALFNYLRTCGKKIIWTLHDCWAFTGHAAFCEGAYCEKWITGCIECPKREEYPASLIDNSKYNWIKKKQLFSQIPGLTIVTPSKWLADLVNKSFLAHYPIKVIHNGVDVSVFHPTTSNIKERLGIHNREIVLGVAALWDKRKGLEDFIKLSEVLDDRFVIVLVGLSGDQIKRLPDNIIGIRRTNSTHELAELYSAATVFVNPTYEDNYPTTNIEAISCGTPVITYNTGGSPESAMMYGAIVNKGNISELERLIGLTFDKNNISTDVKRTIKDYIEILMQ